MNRLFLITAGFFLLLSTSIGYVFSASTVNAHPDVYKIGRALNSIVLNIAEGSADQSDAEFARFQTISIRSVYETVAGFDLSVLYGYLKEDTFEAIEVKAQALVKQLVSFRQKLK